MELKLPVGVDKTPIEQWCELMNASVSADQLTSGLKHIYAEHRPIIAELILESYCPNRCKHCIYPTDYHRYNETLGVQEWENILRELYHRAGLKRYVFSGRSLNKENIGIIGNFKSELPDIEVGVICDGRTALPLVDDLMRAAPDWIDVSVDGTEETHDLQRNEKGAYRKTVQLLHTLKDSGVFKKINILTCLTTLNTHSVTDMVALLNGEGFKNFFMTPVTVLEGYRPDSSLRLSSNDFRAFFDTLVSKMGDYEDTWLELDIYEPQYIGEHRPRWFADLEPGDRQLESVTEIGTNELHVVYYPYSLTGIRELIVNSDGTVASPKAMAMGRIPEESIFGNVSESGGLQKILTDFTERPAFSFYVQEALQEKALLGQS